MQLTHKIQKAIIEAAILHKDQLRKEAPIPFIVHPYSVAVILSNYTDDEDIIVAGLLHDVLEDVPNYDATKMKKDFGERVYKIVKGVSEDKDPNEKKKKTIEDWKRCKQGYIDNLRDDSFEVLMVSCADKIHNLLSMQEVYKKHGEDLWKMFSGPKEEQMWFYREVLAILKERLDGDIVKELEKVYKEMEGLIK